MRTILVREYMRIPIGRQGENEAARVVWPGVAAEWETFYGEGSIQLAVRRKGDAAPYPVAVTVEVGDVVWTVSSADTAVSGDGSCELSYLVGNTVAKSRTWGTTVSGSLTGDEPTDPPEAYQSWVDEVLAAGASAGEGAAKAAASAEQADAAAKAAAGSAQAAETAASHMPYVDAETGNWFVWDVGKGAFTDTEIPATGPAGKDAPQIDDSSISTATPWSSQKIVETLCPPFEATGNPVTCYPLAGYPLGLVVSWSPTQEGEGDPSPDNIRPIVGRESVTVERAEDNLTTISTLPKSILGGDVDVITGTGGQQWGMLTLTGDENFSRYLHANIVDCDAFLSSRELLPSSWYSRGVMCTHFRKTNPIVDLESFAHASSGGKIIFKVAKSRGLATVAQFQAWLTSQNTAGTPVRIAYELPEALPFEAAGNASMPAISGANVLETDADSVTVTGRADPVHILQQLSAATASEVDLLQQDILVEGNDTAESVD